MYSGKSHQKRKKQEQQKTKEIVKQRLLQHNEKMKQIYSLFQKNMDVFAKKHKYQINSSPKLRDDFSQMCQDLNINPMSAEKNLLTQLGFGDFYQQLAMNILDICTQRRHQNGGIMKITDIIAIYTKKHKTEILGKDVTRAMGKIQKLGNASIFQQKYVCTVPVELNISNMNDLLDLAEKYGYISAIMLEKEKKWSAQDFQHRIADLRSKGILWIDKQVPKGPHFYFLSHMGTNFTKFQEFVSKF